MSRVWGLVLAGGKSSRMRQDKALLSYQGQRLIDWMVKVLVTTIADASKVLISGKIAGYFCVEDEMTERGPLEGLRCALKKIPDGDILIVVPVDMPLLSPECLKELLALAGTGKDFVRFSGSELPCALNISEKVRAVLVTLSAPSVANSERSFKTFFSRLKGETRECSNPRVLCNTNTPEEWQEIFK